MCQDFVTHLFEIARADTISRSRFINDLNSQKQHMLQQRSTAFPIHNFSQSRSDGD